MHELILKTLSEENAREICTWKYEGEYAVYNLADWDIVVQNGWELASKKIRERDFLAFFNSEELVAYGVLKVKNNRVFLGIGLKPTWCGKGYGKRIMELIINESQKRYPDKQIVLEVRSFNLRAIKCYKKVGFIIKDQYVRKTLTGSGEFYYMEYVKGQECTDRKAKKINSGG